MSEKDSGALAELSFKDMRKTNNIGGFVSPPDIVRQCDRDRSGILSDDVRKRKDIADSPAVALIIIINVRKHLYFIPMQRMGIFIPFSENGYPSCIDKRQLTSDCISVTWQ